MLATAEPSLAARLEERRLGMAMAAMMPMIATTIKSSMSEKPCSCLFCIVMMLLYFLQQRGPKSNCWGLVEDLRGGTTGARRRVQRRSRRRHVHVHHARLADRKRARPRPRHRRSRRVH